MFNFEKKCVEPCSLIAYQISLIAYSGWGLVFLNLEINKKLKTIDEKNSRFEMLTDYSTKSSQFGVIKQTLKNFGHTKLSITSLKLLFFVCKLLESYYFKKGFHLWKNQVQNPSGSVVLKR